jgi:hypothetical protein
MREISTREILMRKVLEVSQHERNFDTEELRLCRMREILMRKILIQSRLDIVRFDIARLDIVHTDIVRLDIVRKIFGPFNKKTFKVDLDIV